MATTLAPNKVAEQVHILFEQNIYQYPTLHPRMCLLLIGEYVAGRGVISKMISYLNCQLGHVDKASDIRSEDPWFESNSITISGSDAIFTVYA